MIYEIRTYQIAPGSLAEVEKRFGVWPTAGQPTASTATTSIRAIASDDHERASMRSSPGWRVDRA